MALLNESRNEISDGARTPEAIVAKFPGPLTLLPDRRPWFDLEFCLVAVLLMLLSLATKPHSLVAIATLIFFGAGAAGWITIRLFPRKLSLVLDADGFTYKRFLRSRRLRWREVENFRVWTYYGLGFTSQWVVFDVNTARPRFLNRINRAISRGDESLPDKYGMTADDLQKSMTAWKTLAAVR